MLLLFFSSRCLFRLDIFVLFKVDVIHFLEGHDSLHLIDVVLVQCTVLQSCLVKGWHLLHGNTLCLFELKLTVLQLLSFDLVRTLSVQRVCVVEVIVLIVSCVLEQLLLLCHEFFLCHA